MSAVRRQATFTGFDPYKLTGVRVTDRKLGHGSYATVLELEYMGLKCAGKKIHELLLEQGDASYTVRRFEEECRLLSQVRHPNIVQFLGVYFQQRVRAPILVMEFLPTNLSAPPALNNTAFSQRRSATPSFMTWLWACATSTAKLLPSFTEISLLTMSSSPPT